MAAGSSTSVTVSTAGTATLTFFATDNAGNQEAARTLTLNIDKTLPTTKASASPSPNANRWNKTDVTVTLSATDNPGGSGVKQINYSLRGAQTGGSVVVGNSAVVTISTERTTILTYSAIDDADNREAAKTLTRKIDKTPPVITGMPAPSCTLGAANNQLVQVATVTAKDALSGLASFNVSGISNNPSTRQDDIIITGSGPGSRTVKLRAAPGRIYSLTATAKDVAGNIVTSTAKCTVPSE